MKKIVICIIALMMISVGLLTGCTQQKGNNNQEDNTTTNGTKPKYHEFVNWSIEKSQLIEGQLKMIQKYWDNEQWDECLPRITWAKSEIKTFVNQATFYDLQDWLDLARNEFIKWLKAIIQIYEEWEMAIQFFMSGDNTTGNVYAQEGQNLLEQSKKIADNVGQYITAWRNEL